jgi:serine/threonine protein kinase
MVMATSNDSKQFSRDQAIPDFGRRFKNLAVISRTGRSSTFRAQDSTTDAWVFIKMLNKAQSREPDSVTQFLNEPTLLKILNQRIPCACVVPVLEVSCLATQPYFVEPLLQGWPLSQAMRHRAGFNVLRSVRFVERSLGILVQIHGAGVVHGDLSPENIFLVTDATPRQDGILPEKYSLVFVDFESARRLEGTENRLGMPIIGKAPYMAPELVKGSTLTPRSDLYALGILFYEMLVVGYRPYAARTVEDIRKLKADSFQPIPLSLGVPQLLESFLQFLIALDPQKRFETAAVALSELRRLLELHECLSNPAPSTAALGKTPVEREQGEYVEARAQPISEQLVLESTIPNLTDLGLRSGLDELPNKFKALAIGDHERREIANYLAIPLRDSSQEQLVDFSIYSPDLVGPGSPFLIDVWAYLPVQRQEMLERASRRNRQVEVGSRSSVGVPWQIDLSMSLRLDGFEIENPTESFCWRGAVSNVSFLVRVPQALPARVYPGQVQILSGGMLVARLFFEVVVSREDCGPTQQFTREVTKSEERVRSAFASYSTHDREKVIQRIQGIAALDVDVFLDVLSIRAGQRWEEELWKAIESRDIFYLFWSEKAKASKFVEREWQYALKRRGIEFIHPIPLEDPRDVPPPEELSALHFNDIFLTLLLGLPQTGATRTKKATQ